MSAPFRYLELTSAAGRLLSESQMDSAKVKPLVQKMSQSLANDQMRNPEVSNALDSMLNLGPEFMSSLIRFLGRSVEFTGQLLQSTGNDWRRMTFGKFLRAFESVRNEGMEDGFSKLYQLTQRVLMERQNDAVSGDGESVVLNGISGVGIMEKSFRDVLNHSCKCLPRPPRGHD